MASHIRTSLQAVRVAFTSTYLGLLVAIARHALTTAEWAVRARDGLEDQHVLINGVVHPLRQVRQSYQLWSGPVLRERGPGAHDHAGRRLRLTGRLLLGVVALALASSAGLHPVSRPDDAQLLPVVLLATLVSALAVGVQAQLATEVGRGLYRARHRRRGARVPDRSAVIGCAVLVVVSAFIAMALVHWVRLSGVATAEPPTGTAMGLALGLAALAAPLMVVAGVVHGPSPERLRLLAAGEALCRADRERRRLEELAARALSRVTTAAFEGQRVRLRAEEAARTRGEVWQDASWAAATQQLVQAECDGRATGAALCGR